MRFDIKKVFDEYGDMWKEFKFEVLFNKKGNCRIHVEGGRTTKYYAGGYGYNKEATVIANMINDLMGKNVVTDSSVKGIIEQFNKINDCNIKEIFNGKNGNVYDIRFHFGGSK